MLFDICGHGDWLDIFQVPEVAAIAPVEKLTNGVIISDARVLISDRDAKELKEPFSRFQLHFSRQSPKPGADRNA